MSTVERTRCTWLSDVMPATYAEPPSSLSVPYTRPTVDLTAPKRMDLPNMKLPLYAKTCYSRFIFWWKESSLRSILRRQSLAYL